MSAFMVSAAHIDALVITALTGPSECPRQQWYAPRFGSPARVVDTSTVHALGDMLIRANLASIHARYFDTIAKPENTPGPCDRYWERPYRFAHFQAGRMNVGAALSAIACYEYQSCEFDAWEESDAKKLCVSLTERLAAHVPGYKSAPWGIEDLSSVLTGGMLEPKPLPRPTLVRSPKLF